MAHSSDLIIRVNALSQLGELAQNLAGPARNKILKTLRDACVDSVPEVRRAGYLALSKCAQAGEVPDELLCLGLNDRNSDVACFAANCVEKTRNYSPAVVAGLTSAIEYGSHGPLLEMIPVIRAAAAMSNPPAALQVITREALANANELVASEALEALAGWGTFDDYVIAAVKRLGESPNALVRLNVLDAIGTFAKSGKGQAFQPCVERSLHDSNPAVKERAQQIWMAFNH